MTSRRAILQWLGFGAAAVPYPLLRAETPSPDELTPRARLQELILNARSPTIEELLAQMRQARFFSKWLDASRLLPRLQAMPDLTIFVPIDSAWPESLRATAPSSKAARILIDRHVIAKRWNAVNQPVLTHTSLAGQAIRLDTLHANEVEIELAGLRVRNGFVHLIQGLL